MKKNGVLFLCKKRIDEYGKSYGLINSAKFVSNYLNETGIVSNVIEVVDGNSIDREVVKFNPKMVIIEAIWATADKIKELLLLPRHKGRVWVIRIHSKLPFLANEGCAIEWIKNYSKLQKDFSNLIIAPNTEELTEDLKELYKTNFFCLPNIYMPDNCEHEHEKKDSKNHIDIGCFGAIRPMKNQLLQAVAALEFSNEIGKPIKFHINANRVEQKGEQVLNNLINLFKGTNSELVFHDWMNHKEFMKLVRRMDVGMQVSMSETFNIVTADFVWNHVPIVVSKDVEWMPFISKADANSSESIKNKLRFVYNFENFGIAFANKWNLDCFNDEAKSVWRYFTYLYM